MAETEYEEQLYNEEIDEIQIDDLLDETKEISKEFAELEDEKVKKKKEIGLLQNQLKEKDIMIDKISNENEHLRMQEKPDRDLFCMERVLELQKEVDSYKSKLTHLQKQVLTEIVINPGSVSTPMLDTGKADVTESATDSEDNSALKAAVSKAVCIQRYDPENCHYQKCFQLGQQSIKRCREEIEKLKLSVDEKQYNIECLENDNKKLGAFLETAQKENESLESIIMDLQTALNEAAIETQSLQMELNETHGQKVMVDHFMEKTVEEKREQRRIYEQLLMKSEHELQHPDTTSKKLSKVVDDQCLEFQTRRSYNITIKAGLEQLKELLSKKTSILPQCIRKSRQPASKLDIVNSLLKQVECDLQSIQPPSA